VESKKGERTEPVESERESPPARKKREIRKSLSLRRKTAPTCHGLEWGKKSELTPGDKEDTYNTSGEKEVSHGKHRKKKKKGKFSDSSPERG